MTEGMTWTDRSLSVGAKGYEAPHPPLPQPGRVREISADVHFEGVLFERGHVRHVHAFYLLHSRLSFGLSLMLPLISPTPPCPPGNSGAPSRPADLRSPPESPRSSRPSRWRGAGAPPVPIPTGDRRDTPR